MQSRVCNKKYMSQSLQWLGNDCVVSWNTLYYEFIYIYYESDYLYIITPNKLVTSLNHNFDFIGLITQP